LGAGDARGDWDISLDATHEFGVGAVCHGGLRDSAGVLPGEPFGTWNMKGVWSLIRLEQIRHGDHRSVSFERSSVEME
ncbi:MAG: hypothetical protein OXE86_06790, partial [Alphaproteobacteria bacterium]|nr:hypothetical protein [Alphaproteobacteria bacterium]